MFLVHKLSLFYLSYCHQFKFYPFNKAYGAQDKDCLTIRHRHNLIYLVSSNCSIMIDHLWAIKKKNKVLKICACSSDMSPTGKYTTYMSISSEYEIQVILFTISLKNIAVIIETLC